MNENNPFYATNGDTERITPLPFLRRSQKNSVLFSEIRTDKFRLRELMSCPRENRTTAVEQPCPACGKKGWVLPISPGPC